MTLTSNATKRKRFFSQGEITAMTQKNATPPSELTELWTSEHVLTFFSLKNTATLWRWRQRRDPLPVVKVGLQVLYVPAEVREWALRQRPKCERRAV